MMKSLRVFWDDTHGWTVETPVALSRPQAERICEWVRKVQGPRIATFRGDKREQAARALKSLSPATLHQRVDARRDGVLYAID